MKAKAVGWLFIGGLATTLAVVLGLQAQRLAEARGALELQREQRREAEQLRAENQRMAAAQPAETELRALRADHEAVARLRTEIAAMRERATAPSPLPATLKPAVPNEPPIISDSQWKNSGWGTAAAALETALWAASGGDIDTLAQSLVLEPEAREKAAALLAGLPSAARAEYQSPEHLVALLATKDVPMGGIQVVAQASQGTEQTMIRVRLHQPDGSAKSTSLLLRQNAGAWRLVVPTSAVERYAAILKGPPVTKK